MIENHKIVLYRQSDGSWAAYVPSIPGCHAIMPTREQVLQELDGVFTMIQEEYADNNLEFRKKNLKH